MSANPFNTLIKQLCPSKPYKYFELPSLSPKITELPYSIRIILESAIRNCDESSITQSDVFNILSQKQVEIPFKPSRLALQDLTGIPAIADLASMRDTLLQHKKSPKLISPACPVDLIINPDNELGGIDYKRYKERYQFLKWSHKAFDNLRVIPPSPASVSAKLEYLTRIVFNKEGLLYPDSVVGTDSHTTMVNGLGVVGWGEGGVLAESILLNQPLRMILPRVLGFKLTGKMSDYLTASDLILAISDLLQKKSLTGHFVEFFGYGCKQLSIADRTTIANILPDYGAMMGYFPTDETTLKYLKQTGKSLEELEYIQMFLNKQRLFKDYDEKDPKYFSVIELDLATVQPSVLGPKRAQDKLSLHLVKDSFKDALTNNIGFQGYGLSVTNSQANIEYKGEKFKLDNGSVVMAQIDPNNSAKYPDGLLTAGILAKKAAKLGLRIKPYIKTSLTPDSDLIKKYLEISHLIESFESIGFNTKSGENEEEIDNIVNKAVCDTDIVVASVNCDEKIFQNKPNPFTKANFVASPALVVAYSLAGKINIDFEVDPIFSVGGKEVFLKDIWPSRNEIQDLLNEVIKPGLFNDIYKEITVGNEEWNQIEVQSGDTFEWDSNSTYVRRSPFFDDFQSLVSELKPIKNAYCLLKLGNNVTTEEISPARKISKNSPAGQYLMSKNVFSQDFNTYGSRRGNPELMTRGTFSNLRLSNHFLPESGPYTIHFPTNTKNSIFEASLLYRNSNSNLIILARKNFGCGPSIGWASKGPLLLGINSVIAESFNPSYRTSLVYMGILPLEYKPGQTAEILGLTGREQYNLNIHNLKPSGTVSIETNTGIKFEVISRIDNELELEYYKSKGMLQYVLRGLIS